MFLRQKSGPYYCWYENAHYRFLRVNEDGLRQPYMDFDDMVVDDYGGSALAPARALRIEERARHALAGHRRAQVLQRAGANARSRARARCVGLHLGHGE